MNPLVSATVGIVVAAGSGTRLGGPVPKAFVPIRGVSMAERSVALLRQSGVVSSLLLVAPPEGDFGLSFGHETDDKDPVTIISGGATRQGSVLRALEYCRQGRAMPQFVVIHDAARCLTPPAVVRRVVESAWQHGAATAAVPAVDTLRRIGPHRTIVGELDRADVWQIQTPQAFRFDLLWEGHQNATTEVTDDTSLVSSFHPVTVVEGSRLGFKITTPEDLMFAEEIAE